MLKMNNKKVLLLVLSLVILGGVARIAVLSRENDALKQEMQNLKEDPTKLAREEREKLVSLVSKLAVLPGDEEPVVATVTDKEQLKDQPSFAKAENGDKILIYSKAKKAYIYNQTKNMIVDIVPVNISDTAMATKVILTGVSETSPLRLALVNGSKTQGLALELEKRILAQAIPGVSVTLKATAKTTDYTKTMVVDQTGKWNVAASELAKLLGATVATQSAETWSSSADLMVIVGADFK